MWHWRRTLRTPTNERRVQEIQEYFWWKTLGENIGGGAPELREEFGEVHNETEVARLPAEVARLKLTGHRSELVG